MTLQVSRNLRLNVALLALTVGLCDYARAADAPALTPEQTSKVEAAKTAAEKDPAVKTAAKEFAEAQKAYRAAKATSTGDEGGAARMAYTEARGKLDKATRVAMLAADASVEPLLEPLPAERKAATVKPAATKPALDEDGEKLEAARAAAMSDPAVKAMQAKFNAARKEQQADRQKFPADRDKNVAVAFRQVSQEYEAAIQKAMIAKDPSVEPLLRKAELGKRKKNEGETAADTDSAKNPAVAPIKDVPGLPRVLLIGDSVSIGYTLQVRELLKGKANLHRIPINGGATEVGLAKMREWLKGEKWDVIHFNFGLHDAKHSSATEFRASREQYAENLRKLITQMKPTGAKLIFATTTPVPKDGKLSPTRVFDSIPDRNDIAKKVMAENGVAIDDLYAAVLPVRDEVGRPNDVHFGEAGYALLAKKVAESIETQLLHK